MYAELQSIFSFKPVANCPQNSQLTIKRGIDTEIRKIHMTSIKYIRFKVALNEY
jgi:hypothetical protein